MSDSVDRVFVHALNTVKKIPRMGSARPPPAARLKLYGLFKQSMEGDVDGVMERPKGNGEEIRSDQEKWDAWNYQKGLSRTDAKRQYITTLVETMHRYASQTTDARELVSELEFVWDQIKSNSSSDGSSNSYPNGSPLTSNRDRLIYPVMSEHGARDPGNHNGQGLRTVEPISQNSQHEDELEEDPEIEAREDFVDARDSQIADNDGAQSEQSEDREQQPQTRAQKFGAEAGAIIAPIARYLRVQRGGSSNQQNQDSHWQRRIESALIKMNAEVAALREQLEMQQDAAMHSSILRPFTASRRNRGYFSWLLGSFFSVVGTIAKHLVIDALLLAALTVVMHYRGIPVERPEDVVCRWIEKVRQFTLLRRLEKRARRSNINMSPSMQRSFTFTRPPAG